MGITNGNWKGEREQNYAEPGIGNGNGNEPLGMGGNWIVKDIAAHLSCENV